MKKIFLLTCSTVHTGPRHSCFLSQLQLPPSPTRRAHLRFYSQILQFWPFFSSLSTLDPYPLEAPCVSPSSPSLPFFSLRWHNCWLLQPFLFMIYGVEILVLLISYRQHTPPASTPLSFFYLPSVGCYPHSSLFTPFFPCPALLPRPRLSCIPHFMCLGSIYNNHGAGAS